MKDGGIVVELAKKALVDEMTADIIYSSLSRVYGEGSMRMKLLRIAKMESGHAGFWREFLEKRGVDTSRIKVNRLKIMIYVPVLRLLGLGLALRILENSERDAVELYSRILESGELDRDEEAKLREILEDELVHEHEFAEEESKFEDFLEHVRDMVLGMNDGLVEILSVTAGLAGVYGNPFHVALGGLVVGVAGALSMGIGAFAATRAQRQVHEGTLRRIGLASRYVAHIFREKIREFMKRKGYSEQTSENVAEESLKDSKLMSKIIAEEEYGLREEKLENPSKAGLYTGLAYFFASFFPLLPYFLGLPIFSALFLSLFLAALALSATGFIIAISADLPIKNKILEMVLAGLGSAAVTFMIGRVFSTLFGIEVG